MLTGTSRNRGLLCVLRALALLGLLQAANAATTVQVDDTGTIVTQPVVSMRWRKPVPSRAMDDNLDGEVRVGVRLNMAPFLNKSVPVYMALAPVDGQTVTASWRTQGRLLAGTVRSGGRTLVYHGPVTASVIEETIDLLLTTDGRNMAHPQTLQFYFEVDLP